MPMLTLQEARRQPVAMRQVPYIHGKQRKREKKEGIGSWFGTARLVAAQSAKPAGHGENGLVGAGSNRYRYLSRDGGIG